MRSLEGRYRDVIVELRAFAHEPPADRVELLARRLGDLDHEVRTTVDRAGDRFYELGKLGVQANDWLVKVQGRLSRADEIAQAAEKRERWAAEHPTVLDADPRAQAVWKTGTPTRSMS